MEDSNDLKFAFKQLKLMNELAIIGIRQISEPGAKYINIGVIY